MTMSEYSDNHGQHCIPAGVHCNCSQSFDTFTSCNITDDFLYQNGVITDCQCLDCYVPSHCLQDNVCAEGTSGASCEQCLADEDQAYYSIGSSCVECCMVPPGVPLFLVILILTLVMLIKQGFSEPLFTKLKQLVNFLQFIFASVSSSIELPRTFVYFGSVLSGATYADLKFLTLDCFFDLPIKSYYLEWSSTLGHITLAFLVAFLIDKRLKRKAVTEISNFTNVLNQLRKRTYCRRLVVFLWIWWFVPLTTSFLHSWACRSTIPKTFGFEERDSFLHAEEEEECSHYIFQTLNFLLSIYAIAMIVFGPFVLIFFTLRTRKWELLETHSTMYGAFYESYKPKYCFWDAIILLRKLIGCIVTEYYPFSAVVQNATLLTMSLAYLVAVIICRPFRSHAWRDRGRMFGPHHLFEVCSSLAVCVFHSITFLWAILPRENFHVSLVYVGVAIVCVNILLWIVLFLAMPFEVKDNKVAVLEATELEAKESSDLETWVRNNEGEVVDLQELESRKEALDFYIP